MSDTPLPTPPVAAGAHVAARSVEVNRPQMGKPAGKPPTPKGKCGATRYRHGKLQACTKSKGHDGDHGAKGSEWRPRSGDSNP